MSGSRCPVLIGRGAELERLRAALEDAHRGHGSVVAVVGEPGIGKTRLVAELADGARVRSRVLVGRAIDDDVRVALRPLTEALLGAVRHTEPPVDRALDAFRPALGRLIPHWSDPGAAAPPSPLWLAEGVLRLLRSLAGPHPQPGLLLVLEDLHWGDPDTLGALEYLADNLAGEPVLIVVTTRDEPAPVRNLLVRLGLRGTAGTLTLAPLQDDEVADMALACAGRPTAADTLATLIERAAGVPLLVEGLLAMTADAWHDTVPPDYAELVRRRVAGLDPAARQVMRTAAVLGATVDWPVLTAGCGLDDASVQRAVRDAVEAGLLESDDGVTVFRHALTRDAVESDLLPPERAALASRALEAVIGRAGPDGADHALAARLALASGDRRRATELLVQGGRADRRRGALATARTTLNRAAELAEGPLLAAVVAEELAEVLVQAGLPDEAAGVTTDLVHRLDELDAAPSRRIAAMLRLARAFTVAGRWDRAAEQTTAARVAGGDGPAADLVDAHVAMGHGDFDRSGRLARGVLAATDSDGPPELVCEAWELLGRLARRHDLVEAERIFGRGLHAAERAGLPVWRARALHELSTVDVFADLRLDRAELAAAEAVRIGAVALATMTDFHRAALHCWRGESNRALDLLATVIPTSRRLNLPILPMAVIFESEVRAEQGEVAAALSLAAEARELAPEDDHVAAAAEHTGATVALLAEDRATALAALERGIEHVRGDIDTTSGPPLGRWALLSTLERGEAALTELNRHPGRNLARWTVGHVEFARAVVRGRQGDTAGAEQAFALGDQAFGTPVEIPHLRHVARRLVAEAAIEDGWGDPQRWLAEDLHWFDAAGLDALAGACHALLRRCGSRIPRRVHGVTVPAGLRERGVTGREMEVLLLVAEGLGNRDVAQRLVLSPRTVEKHVERLLAKTGSSTRTELVARTVAHRR